MNFYRYFNQHPLRVIMALAIITRLVAVFFAKGFGWFDDHFLIIEASQSWVDGYDYNNWLPSSAGNNGPTGHNLFYTGLHYVFFRICAWIGLEDPQYKMFIVRLMHASLSLLVVYMGYKLADFLGGKKSAVFASLLLAILWIFPFVSVRNLVEFTCIPFLLWGTLILLRESTSRNLIIRGLIVGLILGMAFCMRFQSLVYIGGIGLGLLILGRWKEAFSAGAGFIITSFVCLGTIDIFIWGYPFAELGEYINYNMHNYTEYTTGPWYQYILVILGVLIPPLSLFLAWGFFYNFFQDWRKSLLIFLPVIIFFVFHSYYPNKQERFILPVIPFIIILGTVGWHFFLSNSGFWQRRKNLLKICIGFFWVINIAALIVLCTTYSKRARVESMVYLSKYANIETILVENTNQYDVNLIARFYLKQWPNYVEVSKTKPVDKIPQWLTNQRDNNPDFFLFEGEKNIESRVDTLKKYFPAMKYETTIRPGFIDRLLFWLNPVNENQNVYIYRNTDLHPKIK